MFTCKTQLSTVCFDKQEFIFNAHDFTKFVSISLSYDFWKMEFIFAEVRSSCTKVNLRGSCQKMFISALDFRALTYYNEPVSLLLKRMDLFWTRLYILFSSSSPLQADKNVSCVWDLLLWKDLFGKASSFSVDTFIA